MEILTIRSSSSPSTYDVPVRIDTSYTALLESVCRQTKKTFSPETSDIRVVDVDGNSMFEETKYSFLIIIQYLYLKMFLFLCLFKKHTKCELFKKFSLNICQSF